MLTVYQLKPAFQQSLRPGVTRLAAAGVTANQVTLAALALSVLAGIAIALWPTARWPLLALPVVLLLRMALNAIDGMLAREHGMQSRLGAVLNELGDVLSDTALYLPLALLPGVPAALVVGLVLGAVLTELAGIMAVQIGASRRYDGPMGKSDRALWLGALALLLGLGAPVGWWLTIAFIIINSLLAITVYNRLRRALEEHT